MQKKSDAHSQPRAKARGAVPGRIPRSDSKPVVARGEDSLAQLLDQLMDLDGPGLREAWQRLLKTTPPSLKSRVMLRMELAWALQARVFGDLDASTRRELATLARPNPTKTARRQSRLSAGTVIVREWHGREYRVEVLADGYLFEGKRYRSLSGVAHQIAGVRWSGKRFFKLKSDEPRP